MSEIKSCRVCGSSRLKLYLDLGSVPLCNSLLKAPAPSPTFPIEVYYCDNCSLSQLGVVVDPEIMFSDYVYHSSVSKTFQNHCFEMAKHISELYPSCENPLVVDIASNDGCLLRQFRDFGFKRLLGFEPAKNMMSFYDNHNVETYTDAPGYTAPIMAINSFFDYTAARNYRDKATQGASYIIAQNVLAHVDNIKEFLCGVEWLLDDSGVFVVEVPYLYHLLINNEFDTIYHEHLSYFLLKPLIRVFKECGLNIIRVEQYDIHGGSIRIYADKGKREVDESVREMEQFEWLNGLYEFKTYEDFAARVEKIKDQFQTMLEILYTSKKKVIAYGASAKGISLLNYCDIPSHHLQMIIDDTPAKQGKYAPGTQIPIVGSSHLEIERPDFLLLLAWNFQKELISKTFSHKERGGYYIVPIPEFMLI